MELKIKNCKNNREAFIFLLLMLVFPLNIISQDNTTNSSSLLWKISGNNMTKPSYLFGTIHIIPETDFYFPVFMQQKFDSCDVLVMEAELNITAEKQAELAKQTLLPDDKTLEDFLDDVHYKKLLSYLKDSMQIQKNRIEHYLHLKPYFFYEIILIEKLEDVLMYEQYFDNRAKHREMQINSLESIDYQVSLINRVSINKQLELLTDGKPDIINGYNNILKLYKQQDIDLLYNTFSIDDFAKFEHSFVTTRNKTWILKIKEDISRQPCFIAVGVGHLSGDNGLIKLLKLSGYSITPVFK